MINLGDAILFFKGDMSGLNSAIGAAQSTAQAGMGNIAQASRMAGVGMVAFGAAAVGGIGVAVTKAATFEQALRNAVSVTGLTGEAADVAQEKMNKLAITLGQKTAFNATQVANAFYDLNSKGFDAASMSIDELLPFLNLASATQSELTQTTETVTATLKAFGMENSQTGRIADVFTTAIGKSAAKLESFANAMPKAAAAAKATGVGFEETSAALAVLFDTGIRAEAAGVGMRNIMLDLTNSSPKLEEAFARLVDGTEKQAMTVADLDLKTNGLAGAFDIMRDAGMSGTDIMAAFGKQNGVAANLIFENTGKLRELTGELQNNAAGAAKRVADMQLDTLHGALIFLLGTLETVAIVIGETIVPSLKSIVEAITPVFSRIIDLIKAHQTWTKWIIIIAGAVGGLSLVLGTLLVAASLVLVPMASLGVLLGGAGLTGAVVGLTAAIAGPAMLIVAITAAVVAFGLIAVATYKSYKAQQELKESTERLAKSTDEYTQYLKTQGVVLDEVAMAEMDSNEKVVYQNEQATARKEELMLQEINTLGMGAATKEEINNGELARITLGVDVWQAAMIAKAGFTREEIGMMEMMTDAQKRSVRDQIEIIDVGEQDIMVKTARIRQYLERLSLDHEESPSVNALAEKSMNGYLGMLGGFAEQNNGILGGIRDAWFNVWGSICDYVGGAISWLKSAAQSAMNMAGQALGFSSAPGEAMADGGRTSARSTLWGEAGPELAPDLGLLATGPTVSQFPKGTRIMGAQATSEALSGDSGDTININITDPVVRDENDITSLAREVSQELGRVLSQRRRATAGAY